MENQVCLDSQKYDEFLRVLFILKDICNDVDIRNGLIRQKSNDSSTVFEINLTDIITNISLPISELKNKLDILKCFLGEEVSISSNDNDFTISDQYSMIKIKKPILDFFDNKFISQEEINSAIQINPDELILSTQISKKISDRMKIISSSFHVNTVQARFDGELATIDCSTNSKDNSAQFITGIVLNRSIPNASSNLVIIPFIIDHDGDITYKMFDSGHNYVINLFSTSIGSINLDIYTRAEISNNE